MELQDTATQIAWRAWGQPYRWGGDDSIEGFDCSGLIIEILKSVGKIDRGEDYTADGLYIKFIGCKVKRPYEGCLVFWTNRAGKISHVEYCISSYLAIGASGGGSGTQTKADAAKHNAYVKVRPIASRAGVYGFVDPFQS